MWPRIVAEALRQVDARAHVASRRPNGADLEAVLDTIRAAQAPQRTALTPPAFLHPHQHDAWRRVTAALDVWQGALLLESVGSGKTWIALGVAARQPGRVVALVPAILSAQWQDAAAKAKVPLQIWTHERASRGALPRIRPELVIVDEAHRLRDPATKRVRTLAPWLVGCRILLLTATPVVNRLTDLIAILRLALRDDALALDGIASLTVLESCAAPPTALRRVAIRSAGHVNATVERRVILLAPDESEGPRAAAAVAAIDRLELSTSAAIRRLLTSVLLDAAASSDGALHQALRRYRALLLQARDAGGASRSMLRQFAGESLDQLVFWPLVIDPGVVTDLPLADIRQIELLLRHPPDDEGWTRMLMARCDDDRVTVWFTRHRATARHLRIRLGDNTAWVTGGEAGIGPHRVPRAAVLAAFGSGRQAWQLRRMAPRTLVATDVAAEGLDLQSAGRVIHVDTPWTATRIEQREGRLLRLGQQHPHVDVVVRMPSPVIEAALAQRARVRRKRRLADEWLHAIELDDHTTDLPASGPLVSWLTDQLGDADLVAVRLQRDQCTGLVMMARECRHPWRMNDDLLTTLLARAPIALPIGAVPEGAATVMAEAGRAAVLNCTSGDPIAPALVRRIHRLARQAAARRDGDALQRLDRLLCFAGAPQTMGGRAILGGLTDLSDRDFLQHEAPLTTRRGAIQATAIAAICFRSGTDD